ncbi:MAG: hypothetical protein M1820_010698 [Bogoriella megaspora]|nr:MAG: hypothetical protein M1820_010698 [Bogoriella megaspora]
MEFKSIFHQILHEAISAADEITRIQRASDASTSANLDSFAPNSPISIPDALHLPRKKIAEAAARLLQLSTDPKEYLEQLASNYQNLVCLRWLVNLNVLEYIPLEESIAYSQLAKLANVPESQLKGVIRMAIINGFLYEPETGMVAHSRSSALLVKDHSFMNWARWMTNYSVPTAYKFPDATQRWGKTEAKTETAFNLAMNVRQPFFDHLRQNADMNTMFSGYMRNVASTEGISFKHLVNGFNWSSLPKGATVVDVGGSGGHASEALARQYPHLNFIVQDLPETIANAKKAFDDSDTAISSRIKFMQHDFFQPQPIKDANVYLLRMIIHDWPDSEASKILKHLQQVLDVPNARIVIMDTVLPRPNTIPTLQERQLRVRDLTMMQVFNAKEREIEDWRLLTENAGLQVIHVEQPSGSNMAILEVGHTGRPTVNGTSSSHPSNVIGNHELQSGINGIGIAKSKPPPVVQPFSNGVQLPTNGENGIQTTGIASYHGHSPVLVIGAGIGGLCLAQGLHKAGVDVLVFERDPSESYRPQGYRLKLESDAAAALRESLPDSVYRAFEASCAISATGETDFDPISGACIKSRAGGGLTGRQGLRASYTVDRAVFRRILRMGIEDKVIFGKEFVTYDERLSGDDLPKVTAKFTDGSQVTGSFLVGADGSRSIIRRQFLPKQKFVDTGAVCIYGKTTITPAFSQSYPERALQWMTAASDTAPLIQSILIGDSPLTLLSEPIRFSASSRAATPIPLPDDYVYWVLIGRKELFIDTTINATQSKEDAAILDRGAEASARHSLELTKEWHPSLRALFELQDVNQCSTLRVVSAVPEIPGWQPSRSVTLVGDAIHAMSPCGGVGANTALRDAAELAALIVKARGRENSGPTTGEETDSGFRASAESGKGDRTEVNGGLTADMIGRYEEGLRKRAFVSLMRSFAGSKKMFGQRPFGELPVVD